ncbi:MULTISPECIES: helix-turn-helix transcriptional regulator [unclassified Streptomyces]|uniref:helix-turn-helix domain-containing protein n=1 Tax=unclassified Streptomyces TaxID=2593676 RepID=UPI003405AAC4
MTFSGRPSLAEKLKALMASRRDAKGRAHTSRSLSAAIDALPGDHASVSHAAVNKLANGTQDNPTLHTIVALCRALGGVPPAHLLPHDAYSDLAALKAFEDPRARHILALLGGMPDSAVDDVVAHLKRRRAELGLEPVRPRDEAAEDEHLLPEAPEEAPKIGRRRRRSSIEAAEYAADSLEGL